MTLKERWVAHPAVDLACAIAGGAVALLRVDTDAFLALAGAIVGTSGVLLGMATVVYALFQQSPSPRIAIIRVAYRDELRLNWKAVMFGFITTCGLGIAIIVAHGSFPAPALALLGFASGFMLIRASRLAWLLNLYIDVDRADSLPTVHVRQDIADR